MADPVLKLTSRQRSADTYRFVCEPSPDGHHRYGWACCTVNDDTGELLITSDWGAWTHRWDINAMSDVPDRSRKKTLTEFVGDFLRKVETVDKYQQWACGYLADKLQHGKGKGFCSEATVKNLRQILIESRREDASMCGAWWRDKNVTKVRGRPILTRELTREIWDSLDDLRDIGQGEQACTLFHERCSDELREQFPEVWDHFVTAPTAEDEALRLWILPGLVRACAAEVERRGQVAKAEAEFKAQLGQFVGAHDAGASS